MNCSAVFRVVCVERACSILISEVHCPKFVVILFLCIESGTFYTNLVCHIHRMLREREKVYQDDDWVLKEAMDMHNLQTGGTFMNALTRKLDDIITPRLAEIIAFVDRGCNLSLLQPTNSPLSQFWLMVFACKRAEEALKYTDMVGGQKVNVNPDNTNCAFPFSWLVRELVDSHWDSAQSTGGMCIFSGNTCVACDMLQVPINS